MAQATELMAAGMPVGQAIQIGSSINTAVAAAGSGQSSATVLTATYSIITSGSGGVMLPVAGGAPEYAVHNVSGGGITVYPSSGQTIYAGSNTSINTGLSVSNNKTAFFEPVGNAWIGSVSA